MALTSEAVAGHVQAGGMAACVHLAVNPPLHRIVLISACDAINKMGKVEIKYKRSTRSLKQNKRKKNKEKNETEFERTG